MAQDMVSQGKYSWRQSLERLIRYRLFVPLKRSRHSPEHAARGVMIGVAWSMTPFFGIQMVLVFLTWLISHKLLRWDFSLVAALAWTWVTNIFTIVPFFYAFYLTGQLMLGRFGNMGGYESFRAKFDQVAEVDASTWDQMMSWLNIMISDVGVPLTVGSIVWAVACGWLSYYLAMRFIIQYRSRRSASGKADLLC